MAMHEHALQQSRFKRDAKYSTRRSLRRDSGTFAVFDDTKLPCRYRFGIALPPAQLEEVEPPLSLGHAMAKQEDIHRKRAGNIVVLESPWSTRTKEGGFVQVIAI